MCQYIFEHHNNYFRQKQPSASFCSSTKFVNFTIQILISLSVETILV